MAAHTFETISKDLKNKVYHPVYFLCGEEPYYIDELAETIEKEVLTANEKEFNQTIFYGRDADLQNILSAARRFPMMANYQVVIVREAQDLKNLFKRKKESEEDAEEEGDKEDNLFASYLSNPQKSTILVFCYKYKTVDRRTKIGKQLEKSTVFFESKKLYPDKIPAWIVNYLKTKKYKIQEQPANLLAEYLGVNLSKLVNEIDKLLIGLPEGSEVNSQLIEKNIGISKDYNVFELQTAMAQRDFLKINRIINYFEANPKSNPLPMILPTLSSFFNKLILLHILKKKPGVNISEEAGINFFFLKDYQLATRTFSMDAAIKAIYAIHEYDLRSKGIGNYNAGEGELLREMIFKIMHPEVVTAEYED